MIDDWSNRARTVPQQARAADAQTRRLLVQLALDLHDGPLQDVAALLGDLRLYRSQLEATLTAEPEASLLLGRLDDLEARALGLDASLRGFVRETERSLAPQTPLRRRLVQCVTELERQTDIEAALEIRGPVESVPTPQQAALARVVQEALTNARKHSGAAQVRVRLHRSAGWTLVEIVDDGCGFDVEEMLLRAAREHRFGLVGMAERVRMLEGRFDVQSRPGGPTRISAALPDGPQAAG